MENAVERYRKRQGWTQSDLARMSGVPVSTINEIERGKRTPGVDIALKLSAALGVVVNDLFFLSD